MKGNNIAKIHEVNFGEQNSINIANTFNPLTEMKTIKYDVLNQCADKRLATKIIYIQY